MGWTRRWEAWLARMEVLFYIYHMPKFSWNRIGTNQFILGSRVV